ncbi:hypothetical protein NAEGRDRAFT_81119 [Naegleria gruberi]|uniref:ubiquitinyl hydrolase 1 n=1 Tax=Naegleria gruberi TaxID=5762 RepID=D2VSX9_NAEGR|nr:uncharacterized protein NAEGRDRAFT_81119 [Naegleria gruberi]EFC40055.1 hypothetical protein NAEGRDRAFT_81119 [Naegleria gruberi]|eukprot:XP_002672799.1 hypothetical protein NAEGRDRAFT_81119 [Naegleria gruberi strain NEG-M]
MKARGVLITVPEYRLSFELKCIESIKSKSDLFQQLFKVQDWLENNCRDLLDESDEILHARYQLIYTIGNQLKIDGRDQRWNVLQKVFRSIKKHSKGLFDSFGSSCVELREMNNFEHSFPHLRILDSKAFELLVENIVNDILDGNLKGIFISIKPEHRLLFKQFLTCEEINDSTLKLIRQYSKESQWESLLILRGLLAYGTLELVLERRWRVNYGVGFNRSIAVPFRAKDVPSERSEYGHPDIAILLTLLSYYYSGLDNSQLEYIFEELLSLDDPEKEYCKWVEEGQNQIPEQLKSLSNINLSDYHQKMEVVFPFFKYSMAAIDFYLNKCVFPKECKQFPKKLTSSSWNLSNQKNHQSSGFSGTKSFLLPISIQSNELEELLDTSKNVESFILRNEEYHVISNEQSCKDIIQSIANSQKTTRVLLDVGALMLEMTNEELAQYWLEISNPNEIHAAIYFNDNDELTVIDRYNHVTNFDLSPYKNKLEQCVTYIDDVHTRGTDIKFPESTRAAVTLGNGLSNERFVQACMRMRQLCSVNGHTVSFWASKEVDSHIKKLSENNTVNTREIINWTHFNTKQMEMDHLLQWAVQGLIYSHKLWLNQELGKSILIQQYYDKYIEDEILELQSFYGLERKKQLLSQIFKLKELHFRSLHTKNLCTIFESNISKIIEKLSTNTMEIFSQTLNEEQERELENELEEEKQVFRPPQLEPCIPELDTNLKLLIMGFKPNISTMLNVKELLSDTFALYNLPNIWNGNIYATKSMKNVVISTIDSKIDYYKRPIDWFVHSLNDNYIILICPYEANQIFKFINENGKGINFTLNRFSRRIHISDELLYDNLSLSIPSVNSQFDRVTRIAKLNRFLPDLFILSCSLYFKNEWEQSIICNFLSVAPKPHNIIEMEAFGRGDIDENGKIVYNSKYYHSLLKPPSQCNFDPIQLIEKLLSIYDRNDSFQDSHLYMIIRQAQKPFK